MSAKTATVPTRLISSTWAIPVAGPSRLGIRVGASLIGPASTFAAPGDFWGCPCRPVTARSTCCGIDDFVLRGDLRDRSVFLHLPAISETRRQTERAFWPAFRADYPRILGGVLDAIVGGLRELPSVNLTDLPRMADYAEWGEATSRGLGWGADTFISTYKDNRKEATQILLEDSPVATVLIALARKGVYWSGKPQDLYQAVVKVTGQTLGPRWPKTISEFGSELRRIAPQLRLHGICINFERRGGDRVVTLQMERATTGTPSTNKPKA